MSTLLWMFVIESVFTVLIVKLKRNDLCDPGVITCISLCIGIFFAIIGWDTYGSEISDMLFWTFLIGTFGVVIGSFSSRREVNLIKLSIGPDYVTRKELIKVLTVMSIFLTILYGFDAYRVGIQSGGSGLNAFAYMKQAYMANSAGKRMNPLIRQGFKIVQAYGYISVFLFIKELLFKNDSNLKVYYIISILCSVLIVIFSGSRTEISRLIFGALICLSVLLREKGKWNNNSITSKYLINKMARYCILGCIILFATRKIVKTSDVELSNTNSFLQYLSYYFGSPLYVLNTKVSLTCNSLHEFIFGSDVGSHISGAQVYLRELNYGGNVCTLFQRVLGHGIIRSFLYYILIYNIYGVVYRSILQHSYSNRNRDMILILYSMIFFAPAFAFYSNCFSMSINQSSIITMVIAALLFKYITVTVDVN